MLVGQVALRSTDSKRAKERLSTRYKRVVRHTESILVVESRVTVYGGEPGSGLPSASAAGNRPDRDRDLLVIAPRCPKEKGCVDPQEPPHIL
ncbi:MAG: hypothetical protein CMJ81_24805 [Planctomycetaceae bacterium]|nr:hypothetical protein [Planctomycetaceae bacterium]MBP61304.1 hypothetical protein [Planctomycetaceae bacterium]